MKSAKRILCALTALWLCVLLTGCHGATNRVGVTVPDRLDETKTYELTFWAKNDTNKKQVETYQKAIEEFQNLYPNVKVNMRLYTDYGTIYNDVITNSATDTTPNVCITYPDHVATYLTGANVVAPLDSLMADERYGLGGSELRFDGPAAEEIVPQFLGECRIGGTTYAMPFMRSTEALYVNADMVEALGYELPEVMTWNFIWEVSEAAARKDENGVYAINGQQVMIPFIYKSTDNMMIQMLRQKGAEYSTEGGDVLIFNDVTKDILMDIASHVSKGAFSTFKISSYPANFLNAGQCVFAIDSTAGATWMGSDAPLSDLHADQIFDFHCVCMPIPQFDPERPQMISQGPSMCLFSKKDPHEVLYSWLFMQYLLTDGVQISYAETEGYVPVTLKAQNTPEYQDYLSRAGEDNFTYYDIKIQASRLLLENMENTFVTPVFNGSASLRDAAGQMIEEVTKSTRRKKTVDDSFIDKLYSDMNALYRLDQIGSSAGQTKADLGPLPGTARALLIALGTAWALIIVYVVVQRRKSRPQ